MIRSRGTLVAAGVLAIAATVLVGVSGCASSSETTHQSQQPARPTENSPQGDIPDNQAFVLFTDDSGRYELKVPEGWARTSAGSAVTFTDKLNTVTVVTSESSTAPTVDSVTRDQVPALHSAEQNFQLTDVTTFTRSGGQGVLVRYGADSQANAVTGKVLREEVERYGFWKAGREADLTLRAPQGSDNVDPWKIISDSFRWLP
jgi:hypothetical protein